MYFFIYGGSAALITFFLLSFSGIKHNRTRICASGLTFALFGLCGWLFMPVFRWNFAGNWLLLILLGVVLTFILHWPRIGQESKPLLTACAAPAPGRPLCAGTGATGKHLEYVPCGQLPCAPG